MKRELKINQMYRHFKGGLYITIDVAIDSETEELMVVYRNLHDMSLWVRPLEMFLSEVDKEKYPDAIQEHRFEEIELEMTIEKGEDKDD